MDRMMTRHPLSALWGDIPSDDLAKLRESVQDYGFTDPVIWTYQGAVLDGWHRYTIANLLGLGLDIHEYDGDPVQFVIGKNLHRRHLTELQRATCGNAAREWAKQGHQQAMHTERDKDAGQSTDRGQVVPSGETDSSTLIRSDSGQSEQGPFFTQSERAALNDVNLRTQKRAERYEEAGLGPQIRSGEISGAEAERIVRDPGKPKPPSQLQQLKIRLEAKVEEIQIKDTEIEEWKQKHEFAVSQSSEYPHEKEATLTQLQAENSALKSSVNEWMTKHNDEKRRASWFKKQAEALGWAPTVG